MSTLSLLALPPGGSTAVEHPLPVGEPGSGCRLQLRCLPGAEGLHLPLLRDGGVCLRGELVAYGGESVVVGVEVDPRGEAHLTSPGRHLYTLPPDDRFAPLPPLPVASGAATLDLAIVIDGTTRFVPRPPSQEEPTVRSTSLLADRDAWAGEVERLLSAVEEMTAGHGEVRWEALAFGDGALPGMVGSGQLRPRYLLEPREPGRRALRPLPLAELRARLLALPPTSGGDYVDALPEALGAAAALHWSGQARKLLLLYGDSPGHSLRDPLPPGADARARELDVETATANLHRRGVERLTIYSDLGQEHLALLDDQKHLLAQTWHQYTRLASRPELAFTASTWDPQSAAAAWKASPRILGWGHDLGILSDIEALSAAGQGGG